MGNAEKIAVKVLTITAGVIVAGYFLNMFKDIQFVADAKKGFNS